MTRDEKISFCVESAIAAQGSYQTLNVVMEDMMRFGFVGYENFTENELDIEVAFWQEANKIDKSE